MSNVPGYIKFTDRIGRKEFLALFQGNEDLQKWFSAKELERFSYPKNAGSLAARYLVKKRIKDYIGTEIKINEIEILNDDYGKPVIITNTELMAKIKVKGIKDILCSLSHSRNFIVSLTLFQY